jgi:beta-mannosidase
MAIEHWRRRMPKTMGALIWQLNDCWPVISWSLVDYKYRPKAAWYEVRRAFAPRTAFLTGRHAPEIWAVNDTDEPWQARIELTSWTIRGIRTDLGAIDETIPPFSARNLNTETLPGRLENLGADFFALRAQLDEDAPIQSLWMPKPFKQLELPSATVEWAREIREGREGYLLFTDQPAFGVQVHDPGRPDVMFSDNSFDLLPGDQRWIYPVDVKTGVPVGLGELKIRALNPLVMASQKTFPLG